MAAPDTAPIRLTAGRARTRENGLLAEAAGGRVGLAGVLGALTRRATPVDTRGTTARRGFAWDREDQRSHWWPQGVTSSADSGLPEGRPLLVTTSYAKEVGDVAMGSRITVVDLDSGPGPTYAHVLLVCPEVDDAGRLEVRPVRSHAGGIAWRGNQLHVGSTARGLYTFDLDDVVAAARTDHPHELGVLPDGGVAAYAHRFVLPARRLLKAGTAEGSTPFRYSFLSVSHEKTPQLWVGEYGRDGATTRLATYGLADDGQVATDEDGVAVPSYLADGGVPRMQGVAAVDGVLHVTTSNGRRGRGSIWVGTPGALQQREKVLPPGPEDLCYRPAEDELWTVTEYPRRRLVLALRRDSFPQPGQGTWP
ncbi:hypothetical protein [Nocardioides caldifontis]|uniref:hypothetical protein n=1 Tax=Nocardioides caldifontis TaxID=2588938 RepID=UPI0011DF6348|nr:hypothetical protein [Nocardioides caldifontis]